jgi:hypothetical protein
MVLKHLCILEARLRHVQEVLRRGQAEDPEPPPDLRQRDAGHLPLPQVEDLRRLHHRLHRAGLNLIKLFSFVTDDKT